MRCGDKFCEYTAIRHVFAAAKMQRHSPRKTAESTGKLPPTPTLHIAANKHSTTALPAPPAAVAKIPVMNSVMLNANLRIVS